MSENDSSPEFQTSVASLWEDLKQLTKEVVAAMNQTDELRSKTGGLEYRIADFDEVVVTNQSSPSMDVVIRLRSPVVQVHTRTMIQGIETTERETWESFTVQSDETGASLQEEASLQDPTSLQDGASVPNRASLRSREGEVLTTEQAVYHILRPFLHLQAIAN